MTTTSPGEDGTRPTMRAVVDALGVTYYDDAIAVWLAGEHVSGRFKGRRPIDVCKTPEGRAEVFEWAVGAQGMVAT